MLPLLQVIGSDFELQTLFNVAAGRSDCGRTRTAVVSCIWLRRAILPVFEDVLDVLHVAADKTGDMLAMTHADAIDKLFVNTLFCVLLVTAMSMTLLSSTQCSGRGARVRRPTGCCSYCAKCTCAAAEALRWLCSTFRVVKIRLMFLQRRLHTSTRKRSRSQRFPECARP